MHFSPFKLERYFAQHEFSTKFMLSSSDSETISVRDLLEMETGADKAFHDLYLGYTESQGDPELRKEICSLYQDVSPDKVLVFSGAEEGIFTFILSNFKQGDHIIVQFPGYQSLYSLAEDNGIEVTRWEMKATDSWEIDLDALRHSIRNNTRAIIINSPHNPTGYQFTEFEIQELVNICKTNDLILFSDEVYRFGEYNTSSPSMVDLYEKAVVLGVLSKPFGLPGLRIGWIICKQSGTMKKMQTFKDFTTICNSAPSEFLAKLALKNRKTILDRNRVIAQENLHLLDAFFEKHSAKFVWRRPQAGSVAFVEVLFTSDVLSFCDDLRIQKGVLVIPGSVFDHQYKAFIRIGFGRKNLPVALDLLDQYLSELD